jgi:DNA invertase Pin-like site-specific DNA recombinase
LTRGKHEPCPNEDAVAKAAKGVEMDARPVAGYFRVSQARDEMKAPELYRRDIETFCTYRKLALTEVFSDIDYSAFRGAPARPALEELKRRRKEFSGVVVPKLSRFGRSVKDLIQLFEVFERDGVALNSPTWDWTPRRAKAACCATS